MDFETVTSAYKALTIHRLERRIITFPHNLYDRKTVIVVHYHGHLKIPKGPNTNII